MVDYELEYLSVHWHFSLHLMENRALIEVLLESRLKLKSCSHLLHIFFPLQAASSNILSLCMFEFSIF